MQYIGVTFAILGIALHLKTLVRLGSDTEHRQLFYSMLDTLPAGSKFLALGFLLFPLVYFGICIYSCTRKHRTPGMTLTVFAVLAMAVFYYGNLHTEFSSFARNAMWTGLCTFPFYFGKSAKPNPKAMPLEATVPGTALPSISETPENPYQTPPGT